MQDPEFDPQNQSPLSQDPAAVETAEAVDPAQARINELEAELAEVKDNILRERADLANRQNRLARDMDQARKFANEKLLAELLPVADALEAGLATPGSDGEALRQGLELTHRELLRVMEANGLKQVNPVGESFNPEHHQAIQMIESDAVAPGHVITVFQKGWLLNERLLRPAMVVVRNH
ncbi:nucleotide exchange factor GrpE [Luteimonas sp. FXH3W]|uniref:Protein GrpE n=1 Tax=Aquilutibacter rugosus TaxID=3115820 RepID=A0ABU7V2F3_9GAMM